jgi:hypothetical protein
MTASAKNFPAATEQYAEFGLANSHRIRQHGLEHTLELTWRA